MRWADFDGDGRPDHLTMADNGRVNVLLNRGGDAADPNGWQRLGTVATRVTPDRSRVRLADWDGDGKADYLTIADNGAVRAWLNRGGDGHGGWRGPLQSTTRFSADPGKVHLVDFDADTRADCLVTTPLGSTAAHLNDGNTTSGHDGWTPVGTVVGSTAP
ncbi:FG-GAP repeat domain-containing protein [Streptomyces xanthophaeus]|uniref:FG-GAP repeat domain-containing protein n=1 Tax=Streptomyces xanthophaeus TaxID=67385 RepID=UPI000691F73F|nr:VCBS repeat-containing protein [Streptomyces xanthophaeus]